MKYRVLISQKANLDYARVKHHYKSIDNDLEQRFKTEVKKIKGTEAEVEATIAAIEDVKLHVEH